MGLQPEESGDHQIHDDSIATWTRIIVIPRKELYYPGEEARGINAPRRGGPSMTSIRDARLTVLGDGRTFRDNWRTAVGEGGPEIGKVGPEGLWAERCVSERDGRTQPS